MSTTAEWLASLGMSEYTQRFAENDIDIDVLSELMDQDFERLGVSLGHRRKMMRSIRELGGPVPAPPPAVTPASTAPQDTAERRQLTVMFCDLVGSTALSAKLDPEDMRDIIRAYQDACSGAVARYDGLVAKFMGDGILAYFGYPRAHEDDAERAARFARTFSHSLLVAWFTFSAAVTQTGAGIQLTAFGQTIFHGPLMWLFILAPLGLVMLLSFGINRLSASTALTLFFGYAGILGISLASIFLVYTGASIARVFFISAATFGAMSLYGYTTQRDLTGVDSFMFMGLIGIIIASLVNMFLHSTGLDWAISVLGVLIFVGLTAYDTQNIKEIYSPMDDGTVAGRKAVMGALRLYLDFINLFLMMLRLFGDRR